MLHLKWQTGNPVLRPSSAGAKHTATNRGNISQDRLSLPHIASQTDDWFYLQVLPIALERSHRMHWFEWLKILTQAQSFYLSQSKAQASFSNGRLAQSQSSGHHSSQGIKLERRSGLKQIAERKKKGLKVSSILNQSTYPVQLPHP